MPELIPKNPCVGRAEEISAIHTQLTSALQNRGGFCQITGEAGSGKSTLLRAFVASLTESAHALVIAWGHCDQQIGDIRPLAPWTEILQSLSGMSDIAIPEEQLHDSNSVLSSIRSTLVELAPDIIELLIPGIGLVVRSAQILKRSSLGERLSLSDTHLEEHVAADRTELQDQYIAIIDRVLQQTPLIVVIDDLDSADEASLQLLERLVAKTTGKNIFFLTAMRSSTTRESLRLALDNSSLAMETIKLDLDSVREQRGRQFVSEYAQAFVPGVDESFVLELARHTGGHPLFVAELVDHLRKNGQITQSAGQWCATAELGWDELPGSIEAILSQQTQALDAELLDILQVGSVEGDQFCIEVVAAVLQKSPLSVARALTRRAPRNLVTALGSAPLGEGRVSLFRFTHSLAHGHIYRGIDPVERPYLHESVGGQLERLVGDEPQAIGAQLAYQFEQAGDARKACRYFELAAASATATCSLTEAIAHLQRALVLCSNNLQRLPLLQQLAKLTLMIGQTRDSVQLFEQATALAEKEQAQELANIMADHAVALARSNELELAWDMASRAERLAREKNDETGLCSALQALGSIYFKQGKVELALDCGTLAMELAQRLDNSSALATCLSNRGDYLKELGRYDDALQALQESLRIRKREKTNFSQLASTFNSLADLFINQERYPEARENLLRAIEYWRQFDRNAHVAVGLTTLANLANREGLFEQALQYGREVYATDVEALGNDHPDLAFALSCMGESLIGLQDYTAAIEHLSQAYDLRSDGAARQSNLAWSGWLLGRALVESGSSEREGRQLIDEARAILAAMGIAAQSELNDIDGWLERHPAH